MVNDLLSCSQLLVFHIFLQTVKKKKYISKVHFPYEPVKVRALRLMLLNYVSNDELSKGFSFICLLLKTFL